MHAQPRASCTGPWATRTPADPPRGRGPRHRVALPRRHVTERAFWCRSGGTGPSSRPGPRS
ncbi:hypothetical protein FTX61_11345 [Nitriliruptoraceae bacterium ZYF776]|nr:hypothetical protein [Profundirhabdus halotolerans]